MRLTEEVRRTAQEIAARGPVGHGRRVGARRRPARRPAPARPRRALPRGQRGRRRDVPRLHGHDQLRLRLVARRIRKRPGMSGYFTMATGHGRALPGPRGRGAPPSCARCAPRRSPTRWARPATTSSWRCTPRRCASSAGGSAGAGRSRRCARRTGRPSASRRTSPPGWRCSTTAASTSGRRSWPSDLALAGIVRFRDLDRLTIFADNLVPHVLRCDGVLVYDPRLAAARRRRAPAADGPAGARDPRRRGPRVRAHRRAARASAPTRSTTGCGSAGRRRSTRRGRGTAAAPSSTENARGPASGGRYDLRAERRSGRRRHPSRGRDPGDAAAASPRRSAPRRRPAARRCAAPAR